MRKRKLKVLEDQLLIGLTNIATTRTLFINYIITCHFRSN